MISFVLTVAVAVGQAQTPAVGRDQPASGLTNAPQASDRGAPGIDGNWKIIAFEKNGQAVTGIQQMQVTIRNNVISFTGQGVNEPAMRLEFGTRGSIRLVPGASSHPAQQGSGTTTTPNRNPSTSSPNVSNSGQRNDRNPQTGASSNHDVRSAEQHEEHLHQGVYVLAHDYFALSVFEERANGKVPTGPATANPTRGTTPADGATGRDVAAQNPKIVVVLRRASGSESAPATRPSP